MEPADVWSSRPPARFTEVGPKIVLAPAPDSFTLDGALYKEAPGTGGANVARWFYEDHRYCRPRGHLSQNVIDKMARNNGIKLLGLDLPLA